MAPKRISIAPTIVWGVVLIVTMLAAAALWNVALVVHVRHGNAGFTWTAIAVGSTLAGLVTVGLILFIVSLAKQIRENQRQQNFIDSVTHELKSPLTSLKLYLETLLLRPVPEERRREFLATMLQDVDRLNLLIDHVLDAGRVERGPGQKLEPVDLAPLLTEVASVVRQRYGLPTEAIALDVPPLTVLSDRTALALVFTNLVDNAVKYSEEHVEVRIHAQRDGDGTAVVRVSDRGMGIPPNQVRRIFHRFHRVGNEMTRKRQGTGLGLYIVKETLRNVRGTVRASSEGLHRGSTFTVTLPAVADG